MRLKYWNTYVVRYSLEGPVSLSRAHSTSASKRRLSAKMKRGTTRQYGTG